MRIANRLKPIAEQIVRAAGIDRRKLAETGIHNAGVFGATRAVITVVVDDAIDFAARGMDDTDLTLERFACAGWRETDLPWRAGDGNPEAETVIALIIESTKVLIVAGPVRRTKITITKVADILGAFLAIVARRITAGDKQHHRVAR